MFKQRFAYELLIQEVWICEYIISNFPELTESKGQKQHWLQLIPFLLCRFCNQSWPTDYAFAILGEKNWNWKINRYTAYICVYPPLQSMTEWPVNSAVALNWPFAEPLRQTVGVSLVLCFFKRKCKKNLKMSQKVFTLGWGGKVGVSIKAKHDKLQWKMTLPINNHHRHEACDYFLAFSHQIQTNTQSALTHNEIISMSG